MNNIVLIDQRRSDIGSIICQSRDTRFDRPTYPLGIVGHECWWLSDKVHSTIQSDYKLLFWEPHWKVVFEDSEAAMLFKLAWG